METQTLLVFSAVGLIITLYILYLIIESASKSKAMLEVQQKQAVLLQIQGRLLSRMLLNQGVPKEEITQIWDTNRVYDGEDPTQK